MVEAAPKILKQEADLALYTMPNNPTLADLKTAACRAQLGLIAIEVGANNVLPAEEHWGTPLHPGFGITGIDTAA